MAQNLSRPAEWNWLAIDRRLTLDHLQICGAADVPDRRQFLVKVNHAGVNLDAIRKHIALGIHQREADRAEGLGRDDRDAGGPVNAVVKVFGREARRNGWRR